MSQGRLLRNVRDISSEGMQSLGRKHTQKAKLYTGNRRRAMRKGRASNSGKN
jgi:hypothetical protein